MNAQAYDAVRKRAGLIDCSMLGALEVAGADRVAFLHNLLTNDLKRLAPGASCEAALVSPVAKLIAYFRVLVEADRVWLVTDCACLDAALQTLQHYRITEDVAIHDRRADDAVFALQGPATPSLTPQLGSLRHIACSITGEPGVLLIVPADQHTAVWHQLQVQAQPVDLDTWNVLRLEAGLPWYGVDMDQTTLFPETGLQDRSVSDTKGCYVGQEVIARLATQGSLSRKFMGLRVEGSLVPQAGDIIQNNGEPVGTITSACFSPALNLPIALGYIKRPYYDGGTQVEIARGDQRCSATLVNRPSLFRLQTSDNRPQ